MGAHRELSKEFVRIIKEKISLWKSLFNPITKVSELKEPEIEDHYPTNDPYAVIDGEYTATPHWIKLIHYIDSKSRVIMRGRYNNNNAE